MQWTYNETNECYTDDTFQDYRGAYGYKIIPYVEQWTLYFTNGWRKTQPLGEYLDQQGNNTGCPCPALPGRGMPDRFLFNSLQEAQQAALRHKTSGVDPEGGTYTLTCAVCNTKSPETYEEDAVVDVAIDNGWQVEGNNEQDRDLCPKCQLQANPSYTLNGIILSTGQII